MASSFRAIYPFVVLAGIAAAWYLLWPSETPTKGVPPTAAATTPAAQFREPRQAIPIHGEGRKYFSEGIAPLEVKTSPGLYHHVIKVVQWNTKEPVFEAFARAGQPIYTELPLGSYEIRYASGKTWYGWDYLFGPDTTYSKADSVFTFAQDGSEVSGYTVELILQTDGNLHTSGLPAAQW